MSVIDRFLCLIGAHRWTNVDDSVTGTVLQRCVTCGKETGAAPWESPGPPRRIDTGGFL
jgi:hypothetical protein